ncbi:erythrocyte membrane protein 1, PfEMP1, putative [Plasmodium sp.]|nr:erythrocyte membrane protein 1, PfEMP1, putative [Plasmodium sp.]
MSPGVDSRGMQDKSAKQVMYSIVAEVQNIAHKDIDIYKSKLKEDSSELKFYNRHVIEQPSLDPYNLEYDKRSNVTKDLGKENPGFDKIQKSFSDERIHDLLVDVCLVEKYKGQSIMKNYTYNVYRNTEGFCTTLARRFADIGDIIRGKYMYRDN